MQTWNPIQFSAISFAKCYANLFFVIRNIEHHQNLLSICNGIDFVMLSKLFVLLYHNSNKSLHLIYHIRIICNLLNMYVTCSLKSYLTYLQYEEEFFSEPPFIWFRIWFMTWLEQFVMSVSFPVNFKTCRETWFLFCDTFLISAQ